MRLTTRGIAVTAIAMASAGWLGPQVPELIHGASGSNFTVALADLLALGQLTLSAAALSVIALGLGGRLSRTGVLAGLLFAVSVAGPAHAGVDGLLLPDRPADLPVMRPPHGVTVRPGDTLWAIAARRGAIDLPEAVRAWHQANRAVIGPDPDLILPGQYLRQPQ